MDDSIFLLKSGISYIRKKFTVRMVCTVPRPLISPSTKMSDGIKEFATAVSVDGSSVLLETQFFWTRLRTYTTRVLSVWGSLLQIGAAGERPDFDIKPPSEDALLIFARCYLLKSFPQGDTSAIQRGFKIRVFPLLAEPPKATNGATAANFPAIPLTTRFD